MKLRMLQTVEGSPDGVHLETYKAGDEVEIGGTFRADDLAQVFLDQRWAAPAGETKPLASAETKPEDVEEVTSPKGRAVKGLK